MSNAPDLLRPGHVVDDLAVVAVAALCAHIPMLFIFSTYYRYAMLAWDLNLIVLLVCLARHEVLNPRSHSDFGDGFARGHAGVATA